MYFFDEELNLPILLNLLFYYGFEFDDLNYIFKI